VEANDHPGHAKKQKNAGKGSHPPVLLIKFIWWCLFVPFNTPFACGWVVHFIQKRGKFQKAIYTGDNLLYDEHNIGGEIKRGQANDT